MDYNESLERGSSQDFEGSGSLGTDWDTRGFQVYFDRGSLFFFGDHFGVCKRGFSKWVS